MKRPSIIQRTKTRSYQTTNMVKLLIVIEQTRSFHLNNMCVITLRTLKLIISK